MPIRRFYEKLFTRPAYLGGIYAVSTSINAAYGAWYNDPEYALYSPLFGVIGAMYIVSFPVSIPLTALWYVSPHRRLDREY